MEKEKAEVRLAIPLRERLRIVARDKKTRFFRGATVRRGRVRGGLAGAPVRVSGDGNR